MTLFSRTRAIHPVLSVICSMLPLHLLIVAAEINSAHGDEPAAASAESVATSTKSISLQPGFRVELLRSAGEDEDSWISRQSRWSI